MNIHRKAPQNHDHLPVSQLALDEVCSALNGILSDGVDVHRCLAARASGRIGARAAVQPLIKALLDEDEDVRTDAAEALLELADPRASQQLMDNLLGDPCMEVKLAAIETLAKLQDKRVIPWLQRMVRGRDEEIIWDEEEFFASGWDDWVDIQNKAINALAELNAGEAIPDIVEAIQDEDALEITDTAFKSLARLGEPGIEALAGFLDDKSVRMRRRAAAALGACNSVEAAEPLARAFTDISAEVRCAALRALALRDPSDVRLVKLFEDPDVEVRTEAVRLCGAQHPNHLPGMIDDASKSVQLAVLNAIRSIENFPADEALVKALREKLENKPGELAAASARALAKIAPQEAVQDLITLLCDVDKADAARLGALQGLAEVGDESAVKALIGVIDDDVRVIRMETMSALAQLARPETVWPNAAGEALLLALRGRYTPEGGEDTGDQGDVSSEEAHEEAGEPGPATEAENNDDADVFPTSTLSAILDDFPKAREIVGLPDKGIELTPVDMERLALAKQIKPKKRVPLSPEVVLHEDIRRFAARVLGNVYHADVALELAAALDSADSELRLAAADSLARISTDLIPLPDAVTKILLATAPASKRELKLLLIRALAAAGGEEAPAQLAEHLHDEDAFVRTEAVHALTRLGRDVPEIETLLNDPDPSVRLSAAQGVAATDGADAVRLLVDFAFSFEGYHGRQAACLLRELDAPRASALFINVLHDPARKRTWSVAIEALEELNCLRPVWMSEVPDHDRQG